MYFQGNELGWKDPPQIYHNFDSESLSNYCFQWSLLDHYSDEDGDYFDHYDTYGIDSRGIIYRGSRLMSMRGEGLIIREFRKKLVFAKTTLLYFGSIQETTDGNWFAHSPYNPHKMSLIQVSGFSNEFYAVRYLHQVGRSRSRYPEEWGEVPRVA